MKNDIIKIMKKLTAMCSVVIAATFLLVFRTQVAQGVKTGLGICGEVLIPSLFPFSILALVACKGNVFKIIERLTAPLMRLFGLPAECVSVILFGFTGGYPVGLNAARELYGNGRLTVSDVRHISAFCVNAGPAFIVTAVGEMMLGSCQAGAVILVSVCLASLITGLAYLFVKKERADEVIFQQAEKIRASDIFIDSVNGATKSMITVCAWVMLFSAFSAVVHSIVRNETVLLVFDAVAEVTSGIPSALSLGGLPAVCASVSFGGLCVMCQNLPTIKKCGIKASHYLVFRIVNAALSYVISAVILKFTDITVDVFALNEAVLQSYTSSASIVLIIMGAVLVFDVVNAKKDRISVHDFIG